MKMNDKKFDFKRYLKNLIIENKRMLQEIYKADDAIEIDDAHPSFGEMVSLIKTPPVSTAIMNTSPGNVGEWDTARAKYYAVNPTASSLKQNLLAYHGQGNTASGDAGEQIAASLGTIISEKFPRLSGVTSIQNLNDKYSGLNILKGFFPGADLLFWKGSMSSVRVTNNIIDLADIGEFSSVKRVGTPRSLTSSKRTAFSKPNFSDDSLRKMAAVFLLKWLESRGGTQTQTLLSLPATGGVTKDSTMDQIYTAARNEGVTQIKFNVSDITVSTVPYFNENFLTDNMPEEDIKKYPTIEAIMVNTGGNVTVDITTKAVSKSPDNLNDINSGSATGSGYSLVGFLISGNQHELLQLGGTNFDKASQPNVDVSNLSPQLEFEKFIGDISSSFEKLKNTVVTDTNYTFFTKMKEMLEKTDISNASKEFKAALVVLNTIDEVIKKSGAQFMPTASPSRSEINLSQTGGTITKRQRREISFAPGGHSTLGAKGAEVFTKDTDAILDEEQIPVLGKRIADYILKPNVGLKAKLDKARGAELAAKTSIQDEAEMQQAMTTANRILQPDAANNLADAQAKIGTIDDFIDSMHMFIAYLSLIAIECLNHDPDSPLVKPRVRANLIEKLNFIATNYQNVARSERTGTSVGRDPDLIGLKTTADPSSGNILIFPGVSVQSESLTLIDRIEYQVRLLEGEVLDFNSFNNINDLFKGLDVLIQFLDAFISASDFVSGADTTQREKVAENKIRLVMRKIIMSELKKRF